MIDSLIIKSANDAAVAIAEKISGTEKKFVNKMNNYANKLNLENTNFANPHGLPNKANLSTANISASNISTANFSTAFLSNSEFVNSEFVNSEFVNS